MIELATRVPIRSVRQRLVDIAESGEPEERRRAALALGRAGDEPGRWAAARAARRGARSGRSAGVRRHLCRRGRDRAALESGTAVSFSPSRSRRAAERTRSSQSSSGSRATRTSPRSGCTPTRPPSWSRALARAAPLPEEVRGAVDREWSGWFARHLVSDVLFSPPAPEPADSSTWKTYASDELSAEERELVQKALGSGLPEHDAYQAEPVVELADDLYRKPRPGARAQPLRLAARVRAPRPGRARRTGSRATTPSCSPVLSAPDYAPDVEGLLEAWRRCGKHDDVTRNQIAWAACRAPLSQLLERLAPEIAKEPETLARFIGAAASWAETGEPPLTPAGDEPKAPELAPPTELINDMLMAGPPPEMAEPPDGAAEWPQPTGRRRRSRSSPRRTAAPSAEAPAAAEPRWILVWVADAAEPEQPLTDRVPRRRRPRDRRRHRAEPGGRHRRGRRAARSTRSSARSPTWRS